MKYLVNRFFFSVCLLVLACLSTQGQDVQHYYFRTLDIRNGLSQNTVNAIIQDRHGFMWFGTKDGLNRFDGLSFRVFKREETNLGNNFVTALYEDEKGNIWVGTDAGVYIYDPLLEKFTSFDLKSDRGSLVKHAITLISAMERVIYGSRRIVTVCFVIIYIVANYLII